MFSSLLESFDPLSFIAYTTLVSTGTYILTLMAIKAFRLKHPQIKAWLYILPLVVPLLGYWLCRMPSGCRRPALSFSGFICLLRDSGGSWWSLLFFSFLLYGLVRIVLRLFRYYALVNSCRPLQPWEEPKLHRIVKQLAETAGMPCPRLVWAGQGGYPQCFTFGFFVPAIAMTRELVHNLDERELKAVLAHEMGHLAGRDFILGWFMVVLNDLMVYNPAGCFSYRAFLWEREKACDDYACNLTNTPFVLADCLVKLSRMLRKTARPAMGQYSVNILQGQQEGLLTQRVRHLIGPAPPSPLWQYTLFPVVILGAFGLQSFLCG